MVKLSSVRVAETLNHLFLKVSEDMNSPTSLLFILGNKKNSQGSDLDCRGVGWLNTTTISFVARKSVTMRVVWTGALF